MAAADHMREHLAVPEILIGHSLGGAAVLAAASHIPECKAIATIGAPADPVHIAHLFMNSIEEIERDGVAEVLLAGRPFHIQKQFIEDIRKQKLDAALNDQKAALLVFHAPLDQTVGIENAGELFQRAKPPKSFVSLDGADHLLSRQQDAEYVADVIAAWSQRYIGDQATQAAAPPKAIPGSVAVAETKTGKFTNAIVTGSSHFLQADEPISVGGDDTGPSPYDLLLAALGACKSMTMRMYADHKGYKLDQAVVRLSHDRIHARDCEMCATEIGKVDRIKTEISITGDLTATERKKIHEIAERCPVHRTLTGEIVIDSILKF